VEEWLRDLAAFIGFSLFVDPFGNYDRSNQLLDSYAPLFGQPLQFLVRVVVERLHELGQS